MLLVISLYPWATTAKQQQGDGKDIGRETCVREENNKRVAKRMKETGVRIKPNSLMTCHPLDKITSYFPCNPPRRRAVLVTEWAECIDIIVNITCQWSWFRRAVFPLVVQQSCKLRAHKTDAQYWDPVGVRACSPKKGTENKEVLLNPPEIGKIAEKLGRWLKKGLEAILQSFRLPFPTFRRGGWTSSFPIFVSFSRAGGPQSVPHEALYLRLKPPFSESSVGRRLSAVRPDPLSRTILAKWLQNNSLNFSFGNHLCNYNKIVSPELFLATLLPLVRPCLQENMLRILLCKVIVCPYEVDCAKIFSHATFLLTIASFLLTVVLLHLQLTISAFLLTVGAFSLIVLASLLTVGAFLLTVGRCVW